MSRNNLISKVLCGQAGSAAVHESKDRMSKIPETLRSYELHEIYNVDETALYYKLLPKQTYVTEFEGTKNIGGTQKMKAKDRFTAFICTNDDESQKFPLTLIETSKNPRAFKKTSHLATITTKKAWSKKHMCQKWLDELFLQHVLNLKLDKIELIVDNVISHGKVTKPDRLNIIPLPANGTSILQPMDMWIIRQWKIGY